jgi:hypothetical protein
MIPELVDVGGPWKVLPPGIHPAVVGEIKVVFMVNSVREQLFAGFTQAASALAVAGCQTIYLDGSFVADKPFPGDYDACWDTTGVDEQALDPVFFDFRDARRAQKEKFFGEFFPIGSTRNLMEFFQTDKYTGAPKGILKVTLPLSL